MRVQVREDGEIVETREVADPLAEVERLRAEHRVPKLDGLPVSPAAWSAGSASSASNITEPRLRQRGRIGSEPDELGTPDILLMLSDELAVFDNLKGRPSSSCMPIRARRRHWRAPIAGSTRWPSPCHGGALYLKPCMAAH